MTGLWAFETQMPFQKYQGPPIVVRYVPITSLAGQSLYVPRVIFECLQFGSFLFYLINQLYQVIVQTNKIQQNLPVPVRLLFEFSKNGRFYQKCAALLE